MEKQTRRALSDLRCASNKLVAEFTANGYHARS